jgi:hypothetical protein
MIYESLKVKGNGQKTGNREQRAFVIKVAKVLRGQYS